MDWKRLLQLLLLAVMSAALATPGLAAGQERGRVVLLKVDGLPPELLAAVALPENKELVDRLSYATDLRRAISFYQKETGRQIILPNIRHYFYENGVSFNNMFSETLTLSAAAWAVIDTGQPSVIKGHATFSRDTCYLRSHLDGFRDTVDAIRHGDTKTAALWNLDQAGVSLMLDAYDPERAWAGPQVYRRSANRELLLEAGKKWLHNNEEGVGNIVRSHLSRLVTGLDYTEFNQQVNAFMTARKILEKDLTGRERFDYVSPLFTLMDHQQHIDPHPNNLIHWLVKLDSEVGEIFQAVEKSERRNKTIVAMVSDHGSEIDPGQTAFSFPITRVFRTPLFGGQTVKTLLVESAWKALSTPVPGIDFPRIYESDYSPYGRKTNGDKGEDEFVTTFIDSFGNARSAVHLRNDDLNRLHLVLLTLKKENKEGPKWALLRGLFQETLAETRLWLERDLALFEDYHAGSRDLAVHMAARADNSSQDVAWRLRQEIERDAPQIEALRRLLSIRFEKGSEGLDFDTVFSRSFQISDFIPKQFLGLPNSVYQLSHYTIGLDENLKWISTSKDPRGNPTAMNFYGIMSDFRAANAPSNGVYNPFDLIATALPTAAVRSALVQAQLPADQELKNVVWLKSTTQGSSTKGGEALILQTEGEQIKYVPITSLSQEEDGSYSFSAADSIDPLGLLGGKGFSGTTSTSRLAWMRDFHSPRDWARAAYQSEYGVAVNMLLDILNNPVPQMVDSPDFQKYLTFSSEELKERYIRGLKRKSSLQTPDFIVWASSLWNFNSKARTSGGSHSGLRPIVSRTAFVLWGGDDTGVARGYSSDEVGTTLDIVPTLLFATGMLDKNNRVIRDPASIPERPFVPFPGQVLNFWDSSLPAGEFTP